MEYLDINSDSGGQKPLSKDLVKRVCEFLGNPGGDDPIYMSIMRLNLLKELSPENIKRVFVKLLNESKGEVLKESLKLIDNEKKIVILSLFDSETLGKILDILDLDELRKNLSLFDCEKLGEILNILDLNELRKIFKNMLKFKKFEKRVEDKVKETQENVRSVLEMYDKYPIIIGKTIENPFTEEDNDSMMEGFLAMMEYGTSDDLDQYYELLCKKNNLALELLKLKKYVEKKNFMDYYELILQIKSGKILNSDKFKNNDIDKSEDKDDLSLYLSQISRYSDGEEDLLEGLFLEPGLSENKNDLSKFELFEKITLILSIQSIVKDDKIPEYKDVLREAFVEVMMQSYHVYVNEFKNNVKNNVKNNEPTSLERDGKRYEGKNCRIDLDNELHKKYEGIKQYWLLNSSKKRKQTEELFASEADSRKNKEELQKEFGEMFDNELNNYDGNLDLCETCVLNLMQVMVSYRYIVFDKLWKDFIVYVEQKYEDAEKEYLKKLEEKRQIKQGTLQKNEEKPKGSIIVEKKRNENPNIVGESGEDSLITIWENEHPEESEKLKNILNTLTVNDDVKKKIKEYIVKAVLNKRFDEKTLENCEKRFKKYKVKLPRKEIMDIFGESGNFLESRETGTKPEESRETGTKPEESELKPYASELQDNSSEEINLKNLVNKLIELLKKSYEIEKEKSLRKQFEDFGDTSKLQTLKNNLEKNDNKLGIVRKLTDLHARTGSFGDNNIRFILKELKKGKEKKYVITFFGDHDAYDREVERMKSSKK